jgi:hypothetical protein
MKEYLIWIYTKTGNKKRYSIYAYPREDGSPSLKVPKNLDGISGECLKSGINFVISNDQIDIFEWQEVIK